MLAPELRPYQEESVAAIFRYFETSFGNPLIVLPTGAGKSLVMAEFVRRALHMYSNNRVLLLSHVKELLTQNGAAVRRLWPEAPISFYSAGLGSKDLQGQIVVAGIQSIYTHAYDVQQCDLVLIDEAHLLTTADTGMYRKFLASLLGINPDLKVVGLTATPFRLDSGPLHRGPHALFTDIAHEVPLRQLIEAGYLAPLRCKHTDTGFDMTEVHMRGGDFVQAELEAAVDRDDLNLAVVEELLVKGADRSSWLLFCSGLAHARHLCSLIIGRGIHAACVFGETPQSERDRLLSEFKAGKLRCLLNITVLNTGFDAPGVDLIGMLRPTASKGRYVQMCGRGTRLAEGKQDCLVLDWAGNVYRHGPVDMVCGQVQGNPAEGGTAPVKPCPYCDELCHAAVRECPGCGHEFPAPQLKLANQSIKAAVLSQELDDDWLEVTEVDYDRHIKPGSPDSLKVTYHCGLTPYREWVCLEHQGFAREKAMRWWSRRLPGQPVPPTVTAALELAGSLPTATGIMVRAAGQYFDIVQVRF